MKFIHAADLHLDSALRGLERYDGAPVEAIRGASRLALINLVELAGREEVAFVLIAGDVYDGDWPDYNTGLFFVQQMSRLRELGVEVFIVSGNHDAQSRITKGLRLPDNVIHLSAAKPQSFEVDGHDVVVHGQSFATQAVTTDLAAGYPPARPGLLNIGLLHTSLNGRQGHEPYAPCSVDGLLMKGYDYWALGHIHRREIVHEDPWIVFPGNIQGRHARETGEKGCTLVTVTDGAVVSVEHHNLDVVRWQVLDIDATGSATPFELVDLVAGRIGADLATLGDQILATRLVILGPCAAHRKLAVAPEYWQNEIRARVTDDSAGKAWIEKIEFRTRPESDLRSLSEGNDALGGLLREIDGLEADEEILKDIGGLFDDLAAKLPAELRHGEEPFLLDDASMLEEALEDVKELIVARLLAQDVAP